MKLAICFLAVVSCAVALPAEVSLETPEELDLTQLTPNDIFLEPIKQANQLPGARIIGGTEAEPNSIPYQAAIIINGLSFCGGSLISTNRVLTAAHCTVRAVFVQVRLGAHNFNTNEDTQVRVTSASIRNHASYNQGGFAANDVAVVLLPSDVVPNNNIRVIPLAPASAGSFAGSIGLLSGWGRTSDASNSISNVLRRVNVSVISNSLCATFYGENILTSTICSSGEGIVGGCNGDSGGPLVVNGEQVGIVSFGSTECEAGNPTAFARVSSFRDWIQENAGV